MYSHTVAVCIILTFTEGDSTCFDRLKKAYIRASNHRSVFNVLPSCSPAFHYLQQIPTEGGSAYLCYQRADVQFHEEAPREVCQCFCDQRCP